MIQAPVVLPEAPDHGGVSRQVPWLARSVVIGTMPPARPQVFERRIICP